MAPRLFMKNIILELLTKKTVGYGGIASVVLALLPRNASVDGIILTYENLRFFWILLSTRNLASKYKTVSKNKNEAKTVIDIIPFENSQMVITLINNCVIA